MDDNPNFEEMKKIVTDADMYEENMSRDDIEAICKIITQSKKEVESRRLSESQEELLAVTDDDDTSSDTRKSPSLLERNEIFTPKTWSKTKLKLPSESTKVDEDDSNDFLSFSTVDSQKDATKWCFGFNDMNDSTENRLRFASHNVQFIAIQNSEIFLKANNLKKAKMLYSYHTKMNTVRAQLARMSFFPATLKNPLSIDEFLPSSLDNADAEDTYISRSGRQTKRKVYYDQDEDSADGTASSKKTKNTDEQEWPCKIKTPTRKSDVIESKEMEDFENNSVTNEETKSTPKSTMKSTENTKPFARTRKLTNAEIIKKSSLFSDSPPRLTRNEAIFDKLVEDNTKKKKEEEVMESFQKSLNSFSEDDGRIELDVIDVEDEEPVRRRVVPPPPILVLGRRPISNRKKGLAPLDIKTATTSKTNTSKKIPTPSTSQDTMESPGPLPNRKKLVPSKRLSEDIHTLVDSPTASTSRASSSSSNIVPCPICGINFPERKIVAMNVQSPSFNHNIVFQSSSLHQNSREWAPMTQQQPLVTEEHASSCGDEPVLTRSSQKLSRMACQTCDRVEPISAEYEEHVKNCLRRKTQEDMKNM